MTAASASVSTRSSPATIADRLLIVEITAAGLIQSRLEISGDNPDDPDFQSDGSLSQRIGPAVPSGANLLGQPDTLKPTNGATTAITYSNGAVAMVYHDDPYDADRKPATLPNGGTGARTVYAGFGLEAFSQDAYSSDVAKSGHSAD